jgi:hypothetical protein
MNILKFLFFLFQFIRAFYPYSSNFQIIIKNNHVNPAISFMNLNENLNNNKKINISYLNNNHSLFFDYNTYSYLEDYKYSHKYLLKNKNLFIAKYSFNIDYNYYKYLLLIKSKELNNNRILWNVYVKYNSIIINKNENDKIILKMIKRCIYKKPLIINPILLKFFK